MKKSKLKAELKELKELRRLAVLAMESDDVCGEWKARVLNVIGKKRLKELVKIAYDKGYTFDNFKCLVSRTIFIDDVGHNYEFELREDDQLFVTSNDKANCVFDGENWAEKFCCDVSKQDYRDKNPDVFKVTSFASLSEQIQHAADAILATRPSRRF